MLVSEHSRPLPLPWTAPVIPGVVMDNHGVGRDFGWKTETPAADLLEEIARHAEDNSD
jgi:hypothetical protein